MKKPSRKELRQIKRNDNLKIVAAITYFALRYEYQWKKIYCSGGAQDSKAWLYSTRTKINDIDVELEYFECSTIKQLTISCEEEKITIQRPFASQKKLRATFDSLASSIKEHSLESEDQKGPDENTTLILPFPPGAEPTDKEKLQKVIDFLINNPLGKPEFRNTPGQHAAG